jgi:hypothetical protein
MIIILLKGRKFNEDGRYVYHGLTNRYIRIIRNSLRLVWCCGYCEYTIWYSDVMVVLPRPLHFIIRNDLSHHVPTTCLNLPVGPTVR